MQSGQKSPALLFHDMAERLIFKGRRLGHFSVKKMEAITQLQVQLKPSCNKCGNQGGTINSQSVGYGSRAKEPRVHP